MFTTVLAPGSNEYHYDHIHVDLMRRASGRIICQPAAISGEAAAARAGGRYGWRPGAPSAHRFHCLGAVVPPTARTGPMLIPTIMRQAPARWPGRYGVGVIEKCPAAQPIP